MSVDLSFKKVITVVKSVYNCSVKIKVVGSVITTRNEITILETEFYHFDYHDGVIKWKHFPHYWPSVRGIHRSPLNSPHRGQWRGTLVFSLICAWINVWVNNSEAGDLRRHCAHYDVIVMITSTYHVLRKCRFSHCREMKICLLVNALMTFKEATWAAIFI